MPADRRTADRKPLTVVFNAVQDGVPILAAARDLSRTGLRFRRVLGPSARPGRTIQFELWLPGERRAVTGSGVPVRADEGGDTFALEFTHVGEVDEDRLVRWIERHAA